MSKFKQKGALERLVAQLESGKKTVKGSYAEKEPLSPKDITRINKEIATLKKALV